MDIILCDSSNLGRVGIHFLAVAILACVSQACFDEGSRDGSEFMDSIRAMEWETTKAINSVGDLQLSIGMAEDCKIYCAGDAIPLWMALCNLSNDSRRVLRSLDITCATHRLFQIGLDYTIPRESGEVVCVENEYVILEPGDCLGLVQNLASYYVYIEGSVYTVATSYWECASRQAGGLSVEGCRVYRAIPVAFAVEDTGDVDGLHSCCEVGELGKHTEKYLLFKFAEHLLQTGSWRPCNRPRFQVPPDFNGL